MFQYMYSNRKILQNKVILEKYRCSEYISKLVNNYQGESTEEFVSFDHLVEIKLCLSILCWPMGYSSQTRILLFWLLWKW